MGSIWEASGRHLGGIWGSLGTLASLGDPGAPRGHGSKLLQYLSAKMQKNATTKKPQFYYVLLKVGVTKYFKQRVRERAH